MSRFLGQRAVESLIVLLVMSFAVYGLMGLMPGDPVDLMISANPDLTSEDVARLRAVYGLDQPLLSRYVAWLQAALQLDFGFSRLYARPVLEVLGPRLLNTLLLMGLSLVVALMIALPAGIYVALRPRSWLDYLINLLAFAGISMPSFWLGLLLILLFAVHLGWLPAGGVGTAETTTLLGQARYLVLPVMTLAVLSTGSLVRFTRAAVIETLREPFVQTARAKGVGRFRLVVRHVLRNAMIPVVTILALDIGTLFGGALIVETIFAYPGMGKLIYDAILGNDFNLALVALLFATLVTLLGNLGADLVYAWLDPRISYAR
jgi:peptide/nickel transport system permease protein